MAKDRVIIAAVGDCATGLEPPEALFEYVMEPLRQSDLRFAQCERLYSERGTFQEQGLAPHVRQHPRMAQAFNAPPFEVVSVGSNHIGEQGPEAAVDTIETFQKLGIKTVGAGRNIAEARRHSAAADDSGRRRHRGRPGDVREVHQGGTATMGETDTRIRRAGRLGSCRRQDIPGDGPGS